MRNLDSCRCWRCTLWPCKVGNKFLVNFWNRTILLCIPCTLKLKVYLSNIESQTKYIYLYKERFLYNKAVVFVVYKLGKHPVLVMLWTAWTQWVVCVCVCVCVGGGREEPRRLSLRVFCVTRPLLQIRQQYYVSCVEERRHSDIYANIQVAVFRLMHPGNINCNVCGNVGKLSHLYAA
jgi:hypothetical protein